MATIAGLYVVQLDGTVILKRDYKIKALQVTHDHLKLLIDECVKQTSVFKISRETLEKDGYSLCFVKRNDLFFMALCDDTRAIGGESMSAMHVLRLLIEVIEESIGLDRIKENFHSLSLVLDTMIDYGMPLVTEKSVLLNMLNKSDLLNKAQNALTGTVSDRHSQVLYGVLSQINNNQNALWRYNNQTSQYDITSFIEQKPESTTAFIKDIYVDLNEYAELIVNETGNTEMQQVSGEVLVEAKLPGSKAKAQVKVRFQQELKDYSCHKQCENREIQTIGNHEFSVPSFTPPFGKFTMIKYQYKNFPITLPFNLKANIHVQNGSCQFDCRFERFSIGKEKDGSNIYPNMESIFIKFYFPDEVTSVSLISQPDRQFNFEESEKIGEWCINAFTSSSENLIKLQGLIRLNDNHMNEMPGSIVAIVNLKIKEFSFSGSAIEKVSCNLSGGSTSKDDTSVFKGVKVTSHAKNIEYRLL